MATGDAIPEPGKPLSESQSPLPRFGLTSFLVGVVEFRSVGSMPRDHRLTALLQGIRRDSEFGKEIAQEASDRFVYERRNALLCL